MIDAYMSMKLKIIKFKDNKIPENHSFFFSADIEFIAIV